MATRLRFWQRGIPVILLLLLLAVPPLAGSVGFLARDVREASESRRLTNQIEAETQDLPHLYDLRIALLAEQNWSMVVDGLEKFGLEPATMEAVIGIDPGVEKQNARFLVDRALNLLGDMELRDAVLDHRSAAYGILLDELQAFDQLDLLVAETLETRLADLRSAAGGARDGGATLESILMLETVGEAQRAMASALTSYFGALSAGFEGFEVAAFHRNDIVANAVAYDAASDAFDRSTPDPDLQAAWDELKDQPEFVRYSAVVDDVVQETYRNGALSLDPTADISTSGAIFADAAVVVDGHRDLLHMATEDVRAAAEELSAAAEAANDSTRRSLAVLCSITLGVGLAVTWLIVKPIRRLALGAERIEQGDTSHRIRVSGPSEMRDAARALNGATATLDLVEEQARQMADGTLAVDEVRKATPGPLGDSIRSAIETLAASIHEREELRAELAHEASHDGLTGLPNRSAVLSRLSEAVARARRSHSHVAVMFLDLDGFKQVNDEFGHAAGDTVLKTVGERFRAESREGDTVGRLGGDEFLLVAEPIAHVDEAHAIAQRLVDAARRPVALDSGSATIGVSVGIAVCSEDCGDPTELLHAADIAVYEAKADADRSIVVADGPPAERTSSTELTSPVV